jgi:transposase, IS30 family
MKKAKKLQFVERLEIKILLDKQYSQGCIARAMNRSPGTISDELKRNRKVKGEYCPYYAQRRTYIRKWLSKSGWKKINQDNELRKYIIDKLKQHWNPDEISGRMKEEKCSFYVSKTAIYEWLYSSRGQYWCRYLYSKQYRPKKQKKKTEREMIPNRNGIENRSLGVNNRSRYGHYESDYIVSGKRGSCALSVTNERKSKIVKIYKAKTMKPQEHMDILKKAKEEIKIKTITFDNGIENKYHEQLHEFNIKTFFCDPYSSWQKGGVENVNKMIRRFIPKGTNISKISNEYVKMVESILNNKPRRSLKYKTPLEVARKAGLLLSECSD